MKKENKSIIFSSIALFGVLLLGGLWLCGAWHLRVVTLDTFIGVIATLIGIMVTFAIGWQIINAMELRSKISELEEGKRQVEILQQQVNNQTSVLRIEVAHIRGIIAAEKEEYLIAFLYYHTSIYEGVIVPPYDKYYSYITYDLTKLQEQVTKISPINIQKDIYEGIQRDDLSIRQSKLYPIIQAQYDAIMSEFFKKVSYEE